MAPPICPAWANPHIEVRQNTLVMLFYRQETKLRKENSVVTNEEPKPHSWNQGSGGAQHPQAHEPVSKRPPSSFEGKKNPMTEKAELQTHLGL